MYACNTPNLLEGFIFELCRNWLELQVFSLELSLSEQRSLDQSWSQQYVVLKSQQLPSYTSSWPCLLLGIKLLTYLASLASLTLSLLSSLSSSCTLFWMKEKLHLIPLTLSCFSNYVAYQPPLWKPQFGKNSQSDIAKIKIISPHTWY